MGTHGSWKRVVRSQTLFPIQMISATALAQAPNLHFEVDDMDQGEGTSEFKVVFYEPGSNDQAGERQRSRRDRWEYYVDLILNGLSSDRQDVTASFVRSLPASVDEDLIETARRLGEDVRRDTGNTTRPFKELLLATLCMVLHKRNRYTPEQIDPVLKVVWKSSTTKYLDTLKRGARVASEVILEWPAKQGAGQDLQQLGLATSALYTGRPSGMAIACCADQPGCRLPDD